VAIIDGAKVFIRHKKSGKYLFVLRDDVPHIPHPNEWSLIGGGIEDGESSREAAHREIVEEIGIQVEHLKLIVEEPVQFDVDGITYDLTAHLFLAETDKKINEMILTEGQELRYMSIDEAEKLDNLTPNLKRPLSVYRKLLENN